MKRLFGKYKIEKTDGSPVDPNAQYFVLRIDTDPAARHAVLMYAHYIFHQDTGLSQELTNWVLDVEDQLKGDE